MVFTSSIESTHRVFLLLQAFGLPRVEEYSSQLSQKERSKLLKRSKEGLIDVLVCSDGLARGMDLHVVENVINYDAPRAITTYIHRVGRTARAGRHGQCITILKQGQSKSFHKMSAQIANSQPKEYPVDREHMAGMADQFTQALHRLKHKLEDEAIRRMRIV